MNEKLFRIIFTNQDAVYEIYALGVSDSALFGFLEVRDIVFGSNTSIVVDPSEERLKAEFDGVEAFYVPMHNVVRVDEVTQQGQAKVKDITTTQSNVRPFPHHGFTPTDGTKR